MGLILLRRAPGVELLEYRVEERGWTDDLEDWAHELAEELFGVSELDIDEEVFEDFPVLRMMRDEADAYWASHGWDVTDGKGKQLRVMEYLARPLVCVVEKRLPEATYEPSTEEWAQSLEEAAKTFKPDR